MHNIKLTDEKANLKDKSNERMENFVKTMFRNDNSTTFGIPINPKTNEYSKTNPSIDYLIVKSEGNGEYSVISIDLTVSK